MAPSSLIWSATPTPFLDDATLDDAGIEKLVRQHERLRVGGLFVCGTCGEGPFMPDEQRGELIRKLRRVAGKNMHLAVQVSDTSPARVRRNIAVAVDNGADSVVIAPPWLRPFVNRDFAWRYFCESLEAPCHLPMGIYVLKQPPETGLDLALWKRIAAHPRVAFLKDSSMSDEYRDAFLAIKAQRPAITLRTGYEFDVLSAIAAGYDGCLLGTAILNAGLLRHAIEALQHGRPEEAAAWQQRSNQFLHDLFRPDISAWMAGLKYALVKAGIFGTSFSHLVYPLVDDDRRRIDAALERENEQWRGVRD